MSTLQQNFRIDSSAYSCKRVEKWPICEIVVWELAIRGLTFVYIISSVNLNGLPVAVWSAYNAQISPMGV